MALKRPNAISFTKKNDIHPFDASSQASLEFWSAKNDASLFVVGQSTKKKPNGLTFIRTFDGRILDMIEVGIENFVSMSDLKVSYFQPFIRLNCMPARRPNRLRDTSLSSTLPRTSSKPIPASRSSNRCSFPFSTAKP
jgi:hypothetical protein